MYDPQELTLSRLRSELEEQTAASIVPLRSSSTTTFILNIFKSRGNKTSSDTHAR